jgi:hypothetical protein
MAFLRAVDITDVKRYTHDSGDWVDLRRNLSKREVNSILKSMPANGTIDNGDGDSTKMITTVENISETLFKALVAAWSVDESPSIETYYSFSAEAASWLDTILFEHFNKQSMDKVESGKPSTSPKEQPKVTADPQ